MHSSLVSELAGIATALLWGAAAFCWGELSRRMHSTAVAAVRLALAVVPLSAMHFAWYGSFWPADVPAASVGMLCLSGVVAAGIGDTLYIHGIHRIGPRLTLTITTLSPAIAALFALLPPMHERLSLLQVGGLAMAIAGVTLVVAERKGREAWPAAPAAFRAGIVLSVVSAVCQAFGYLSSRIGMNDFSAVPVPPFSATLIRVIAACLWCSGVMVFTGKTREASVVFRSRAAFAWLLLGVTAGPGRHLALDDRATGRAHGRGIHAGVALAALPDSDVVVALRRTAGAGAHPSHPRRTRRCRLPATGMRRIAVPKRPASRLPPMRPAVRERAAPAGRRRTAWE